MLFNKEEWKKVQQCCWGISPTVSLIYTFDKLVKELCKITVLLEVTQKK